MAVLLLILIVFVLNVTCRQTPSSEDFYHAAVVEYNPIVGLGHNDTLLANVDEYIKIIGKAAEFADIVVFPEGALLRGSNIAVVIPFGKGTIAPADDHNAHPVLKSLSQAARNNTIYVVINIHEEYHAENETLFYNTNVVFDRNGSVIARYRKYNLFSEKNFNNITKEPEHSYFDTDFGVRFGLFTCFDILFNEPTLKLKDFNVTDYIFPTWWFSELPLLTATQEQAAWAYAADSNLLAAGGNSVQLGSSGSGIYSGKKGAVISLLSNENETTLITAKLYKIGRNGTSTGQSIVIDKKIGTVSNLKMKTDPAVAFYKTKHLTPDLNIHAEEILQQVSNNNLTQNVTVEEEMCQEGFCCYFSVNATVIYKNESNTNISVGLEKADRFENYEYKLSIFNGIRTFDGYATGGLQVCAILPCLNISQESCGRTTVGVPLIKVNSTAYGNIYKYTTIFHEIIIKTATLDKDASVLPNTLEPSLNTKTFGLLMNTSKFKFYHEGSTAELRLSTERLGTAGIFARVFSRDGGEPGVSSSSNCFSPKSLLISVALLLTYYVL